MDKGDTGESEGRTFSSVNGIQVWRIFESLLMISVCSD